MKNGTVYNKGFESPDEDVANDPEVENGDGRSSPKRYGNVLQDKIMILGVDGVETVDQINTGKLSPPRGQNAESLAKPTGWRSAQFDFLLEEQNGASQNHR